MSACPDKAAELHALFDGELDAMNAQAFEAHLKTCPGCAAAFAQLQELRGRITAPGVAPATPRGLAARVEAALEAEAAPRRRRLSAALPWALSGAFGAIAASLAVAFTLSTTAGLEEQLVANHVRSTLAYHLVDVATSDRHTVRPWFNGKIDFAPPVVDLAPQGFPLVGGRLDYLDGQVVAALVYRHDKHVINLFVRPVRGGVALPLMIASKNGYSIRRWTEDGLEFWAVSDVEGRELDLFRDAFATRTRG